MPSDSTRPRGSYAKSALRKAEIARTALSIIDEVGHENLTTAEVAARVGMSERAVTYHFPTRDHLLVAAMARQVEDTVIEIPEGDARYRDGLDLVSDRVARDHMAHPNHRRLFAHLQALALDPAHPAHGFVEHNSLFARGAFADLVRGRQRLGLAHPDLDPDSVARHMHALWVGLEHQWIMDPRFDLAAEIKAGFQRLTGQPAMEARALVEEALAQI